MRFAADSKGMKRKLTLAAGIIHLTYGADILNYSIAGDHNLNLFLSFSDLLIFSALHFYISIRNIKKKWIK